MIAIVVGFFIVGCLIGLIPFVLIGIKKSEWNLRNIWICGLAGMLTPIGAIVAMIILIAKSK